jgi:hypothetical protein
MRNWISPLGCVCVENLIGDEGAKALGDALKYNTTLTSLWLSLQGERLLFRVQNSAPILLLEGLRILFFHNFFREQHRPGGVS